ncbi:hypothetical protein [Bradyrhizobium guangdongense]|uniref:hypothetical protein n=1 Tax=Bradyrhizobium guangdongense TaxID=1325090 RepID=UPI0018F7E0E2|nr:hypothetical protein [Bradyrhizobium guangdongense]
MMASRRGLLVAAMMLSISFGRPVFADDCVPLPSTVAPERLAALSRGYNADGWITGARPGRALLMLSLAGLVIGSHVRMQTVVNEDAGLEQITRHQPVT